VQRELPAAALGARQTAGLGKLALALDPHDEPTAGGHLLWTARYCVAMAGPFYVYVIELDGDGTEVYVGHSNHTPEVRLKRHLAREPNVSARIFRRGRTGTLRPDLYEDLNPIDSRHKAIREERRLCRSLAARGFKVKGDQVKEVERRRKQAAERRQK
jgi:hypothetical protein